MYVRTERQKESIVLLLIQKHRKKGFGLVLFCIYLSIQWQCSTNERIVKQNEKNNALKVDINFSILLTGTTVLTSSQKKKSITTREKAPSPTEGETIENGIVRFYDCKHCDCNCMTLYVNLWCSRWGVSLQEQI